MTSQIMVGQSVTCMDTQQSGEVVEVVGQTARVMIPGRLIATEFRVEDLVPFLEVKDWKLEELPEVKWPLRPTGKVTVPSELFKRRRMETDEVYLADRKSLIEKWGIDFKSAPSPRKQ